MNKKYQNKKILWSILAVLVTAIFVVILFNVPNLQDIAGFNSPNFPLRTSTYVSSSSSTPDPESDIYIGSYREISVSLIEPVIQGLYNPVADDDYLVASAKVEGGVTLVAVNLETGLSRQITPVVERGYLGVRLSGQYVVWVDATPKTANEMRYLHLFDLENNKETLIFEAGKGLRDKIDLKDNLLVWQEERGGHIGLYGYNLETHAPFTIIEGDSIYTFPRICSNNWVLYLRLPQNESFREADLYAHNFATGEDKLIGSTIYQRNSPVAEYYACDDKWVGWIGDTQQEIVRQDTSASETATQVFTDVVVIYQQHVLSLDSFQETILDMPISAPTKVMIRDNVLVSATGYHLVDKKIFDVFPVQDLSVEQRIGGYLLLTQKQILWLKDSVSLYVAPIIHNNK